MVNPFTVESNGPYVKKKSPPKEEKKTLTELLESAMNDTVNQKMLPPRDQPNLPYGGKGEEYEKWVKTCDELERESVYPPPVPGGGHPLRETELKSKEVLEAANYAVENYSNNKTSGKNLKLVKINDGIFSSANGHYYYDLTLLLAHEDDNRNQTIASTLVPICKPPGFNPCDTEVVWFNLVPLPPEHDYYHVSNSYASEIPGFSLVMPPRPVWMGPVGVHNQNLIPYYSAPSQLVPPGASAMHPLYQPHSFLRSGFASQAPPIPRWMDPGMAHNHSLLDGSAMDVPPTYAYIP